MVARNLGVNENKNLVLFEFFEGVVAMLHR